MALTSILVVCTGNVCRSPAAEGFLRRELAARFGATAPSVSSAGTMGWEGSGATPESVRASAERGVDIAGHRARMLTPAQVTDAGLVVAMARDHVDRILATMPDAADKTFTLKELVRLLEELALGGSPDERIAQAAARRARSGVPSGDLDVADPLGEPLAVYRAMAAELEDRSRRLVAGLAPARAGATA